MAKWFFRGNRGKIHTKINASTAETKIVPAFEEVFADIYALIIANTSATACNVTIKDGVAGSIEQVYAVPAGETRGFAVPKESAHQQNNINTPWTATCSQSVDSIEITALINRNS